MESALDGCPLLHPPGMSIPPSSILNRCPWWRRTCTQSCNPEKPGTPQSDTQLRGWRADVTMATSSAPLLLPRSSVLTGRLCWACRESVLSALCLQSAGMFFCKAATGIFKQASHSYRGQLTQAPSVVFQKAPDTGGL